MTLEERVRRLERYVATPMGGPWQGIAEEIRRDLAAEPRDEFQRATERDAVVDALRAQVADLTRERDSMVREAQRRGETIVEAVARAEKAERERDLAREQVTIEIGERDDARRRAKILDNGLAERQRATRSALDGLARWARDPGWCLCSEGIAVGHHRKAVCVAAEIERRARETRARGGKR